jgi:hypothetical protein
MSKSEAARSWFGSQALIGKSSSRSEHNPSQRKLDWPSCQWDTASGLALLWDESRTRSSEVGAYPACSTDPFYDIVAADLGRLAEELQIMPARAPKTAKWLSDWASAAHD